MNDRLLSSAASTDRTAAVDPAEERFFSTSDLARRWSRSIRTIEGWRHRKQGPPFVRLNRLVVYRLSDILAFEAAWRMDPAAREPADRPTAARPSR